MERRTTWDTSKKRLAKRTRRRPEETVLYRLVYEHRNELEWCREERFQHEYGALRDEVLAAFDAYLNCGILLHGCARAECEKCDHSELIELHDEPTVRVHKFTDDGAQTRNFDPLAFLAELSQHIPDMWEQTTRYVGVYSARTRGAKRVPMDFPGPLPEIDPQERPSTYWAASMKRVFEIDPLECPKCGATMKIKAFTLEQAEIKRLCKSLGEVPWRAPPPIKQPFKHVA